jgi:integrase
LHTLKEWKLACPTSNLDLAFPTSEGTVEDHKNLLLKVWGVMVKAGVVDKGNEPKYGLHSLRHFFASWCINPKSAGGREMPVKVVQTLLGHSSIVMTMDIYGHLFPSATDRQELAASEKALLA